MIRLWDQVEKAAAGDMSVIIQGSGTVGKGRLARMIQEFSRRRGQPFIRVDCRRGAEHLSDKMFFGDGTKTEKKRTGGIGFLKAAGHGVLFLDEIGDLHPDAQKWLVAPLSQRIFRGSGSEKFIPYFARTMVSTTEPLDALSHCGKFNLDLCHALGRFTIEIPPLSRRKEDIEKIALGILRNARLTFGRKFEGFSDEVKAFFLEYSWPGEIKEMENLIYRAVSGLQGGRLTLKDLPPELIHPSETRTWLTAETGATKKEKMLVIEKRIVATALEESGWDALKAAEKLKISRSEIYRDMARFDLKKPRGR
jgi:DNA-binding NtrC family response regulator